MLGILNFLKSSRRIKWILCISWPYSKFFCVFFQNRQGQRALKLDCLNSPPLFYVFTLFSKYNKAPKSKPKSLIVWFSFRVPDWTERMLINKTPLCQRRFRINMSNWQSIDTFFAYFILTAWNEMNGRQFSKQFKSATLELRAVGAATK